MNNMSMNNIFSVLVSKDVASGSTLADGTLVDNYSDLTDGEIVVLDEDNTVVSQPDGGGSLASVDRFRLAQRAGSEIRYSPFITQSNITAVETESYSAPTQQVDYIGYNGSSGAIEALNSNLYQVVVNFKSINPGISVQPDIKRGNYTSSSSATGAEVAIGLVGSLQKNISRDPEQRIVAEAICDQSVTAANDFTGNVTVVKGLDYVTVAEESSGADDAGTYGSGSTAIAAGDYIRIGTVGSGTALTDTVYKVTAVTGNSNSKTLTLDRKVTDDSGTYAPGTSDVEVIPASDAASADFGIELTGVARSNVDPRNKDYYVHRFFTQVVGFGTTIVTNDTDPDEGTGTSQEVAELEWMAQFNEGNTAVSSYWKWSDWSVTSSSATYDTIVIHAYEENSPLMQGAFKQPFSVYLFPYKNSDNGTELAATLNTLSDYSVSFS